MNDLMSRFAVLLFGILLRAPISAQVTFRASVSTTGAEGSLPSYSPSISSDGRYVTFYSRSYNLVPEDPGYGDQVYVRDRRNGTTERVSVGLGGVELYGNSVDPSISANGRYVAFKSSATNLIPFDRNEVEDIFVRDRWNGTTVRASVATGGAEANGESGYPSISGDGRFIAFPSAASNLVPGDTNYRIDIFVRDRTDKKTERVSVATDGTESDDDSGPPSSTPVCAISADGRFVVFESMASNLVPGDINGMDIFVRDRRMATTELVSAALDGTHGNHSGRFPSISADGRFVAFSSYSSNLVPIDMNNDADVFVRDLVTKTTELASLGSPGWIQGNYFSRDSSISADGRYVAFSSYATNLVPGDWNSREDVFVRDRLTDTTERISVDTHGYSANHQSYHPSISADGRSVAFTSWATNLVSGDTNEARDAFVRDRGAPPIIAACFGDGSEGICPCYNFGHPGHGCENSSASGGALLSASGHARLSSDTLVLTSSGEKPTVLSIFLQGSDLGGTVSFGDGLRCLGGELAGLYVVRASGGTATAPRGGDPPVSMRSAALGAPIPVGVTRHYQTLYRDSDPTFCSSPSGSTWNLSNSLSAVWSP